jgi:hypothetical protein
MNPVTKRINEENCKKYGEVCPKCELHKGICSRGRSNSCEEWDPSAYLDGLHEKALKTDEIKRRKSVLDFVSFLKANYRLYPSDETVERYFNQQQ